MRYNKNMKYDILNTEDYAEPRCVLCNTPMSKPADPIIPIDRILSKYDQLMDRQDFSAAERHLEYWLNESVALSDKRGEFAVHNEIMGFYRMRGKFDHAIEHAERAIKLISDLDLSGSITEGTCLLNSATVFDAAGKTKKSIELFERAESVYISVLPKEDTRFAGLYNNFGLALSAAKKYDKALDCFIKALNFTSDSSHGKLEKAITYLNMADVYSVYLTSDAAEEKVSSCLEKANIILSSDDVTHDGYYAFVCEKCAPVFRYYGWFLYAEELSSASNKIYEKLRNM